MADHSQVEDADTVTKDERFEIEEKVADAFEENFEQHDRVARAHVHEDSEDEESEEDSEESEEEHENTEEESSKAKEESKTVEEEAVDSEDLGHLELARMIWSKKSQVSWEAEALACLGDVSLQAENYQLACTDWPKAEASLASAVTVLEARVKNFA